MRLYPIRTTKPKKVIEHLISYFRFYSCPKCIASDKGTAFTSAEDFQDRQDIIFVKIAIVSLQANGQVERVIGYKGLMIATLISP